MKLGIVVIIYDDTRYSSGKPHFLTPKHSLMLPLIPPIHLPLLFIPFYAYLTLTFKTQPKCHFLHKKCLLFPRPGVIISPLHAPMPLTGNYSIIN